jgi:membrane fusion protein (multidrug efflux system)
MRAARYISVITLSLFPALLLFSACGGKNKNPKPKQSPPTVVDAVVAKSQRLHNSIEANGTIVANEYVELRPEISGRITYLNVPEGKFVQQGTVIARIYDADLQATLAKSKALLALAQKTEERYKQLIDISGINQADYDAAVSSVATNKADIAYTQAMIDKTVIKAPFSGVVGLRQVSQGAYVTSGNLIATIQQTDKIKIDFTLPEEYSYLIKVGGQVRIKNDGDSSSSGQRAQIIATEPQIIASSRNLKVRAVLESGKANPGAFVKVYIDELHDAQAIFVPTNCIIPNDQNKQIVVVRNGKASFTNIKTGVRQADNVAVISGLNEGDTVVVTGVLFAKDKEPVKLRKIVALSTDTTIH